MELYTGEDFYDNETVFENYMKLRDRKESANATMEIPIMKELMGNVSSKIVLDLGCGFGEMGKYLLEEKCKHYTGVDVSSNMIEKAREELSAYENSTLLKNSVEDFIFRHQYDLIISSLAFHYIEDVQSVFQKVFLNLNANGKFIFSIEHPACSAGLDLEFNLSNKKQGWLLDNYFHSGKREESWLGSNVVKYHKTIEEYFSLLRETGFIVEDIRESKPKRELFKKEEDFLRRMRIPWFLFFSCSI